jgi:predicted enzyme related to lactoylglutathione lyase
MSIQSKFVWYDAMTSDCKAAESFYRTVIGWDAKDSGMTERTYIILSVGPTMVGGLMPIPEEAKGTRPCWRGYIGVDDVDGYAVRVKAAGGEVHCAPEDIPDTGRMHKRLFGSITSMSTPLMLPWHASPKAAAKFLWGRIRFPRGSGSLNASTPRGQYSR